MPDYSNPNARLTASKYACSVSAARPMPGGNILTQQIDGSYIPRPGATVKAFLDEWRHHFAQMWGVPVMDVTIVRHSLWEV
ncbi:hypothetical protein [Streptomyces sp. NPDC050428]|uniref:hypothetical protein n=1 Tax=Streptomyces sp. NPDC050428 TaxID=3155757 RepID=UPI00342117CE